MKFLGSLVVALLVMAPVALGRQGRDASGSGAPPMTGQDPTPFEQLVSKLKIDGKKQLPEVQRIFTTAAADAGPVGNEMVQLRTRMVALDGQTNELAPVLAAHTKAATQMANIEVQAFLQMHTLLTPSQQAKSTEAFSIMAGLFTPPAPRAPRSSRGGGGQ